jgi:hypothetical protein
MKRADESAVRHRGRNSQLLGQALAIGAFLLVLALTLQPLLPTTESTNLRHVVLSETARR